jgi:hypothetical protein
MTALSAARPRPLIPATSRSGEPGSAELANAQLFVELARRAARPFDALPPGAASKAEVLLWREAAYWALSAAAGEHRTAGTVADLLAAVPHDLLARAAGGSAAVSAIEEALAFDARDHDAGRSTGREVSTARLLSGFTGALLNELTAPERQRERARVKKLVTWLLLGLAAAALLLGGVGLARVRLRSPDLTRAAQIKASSELKPCAFAADCGNAFFHTREEASPWLQYDLGKPHELHEIEVSNRTDCCQERAVPLVVEASLDGQRWTELARTERAFATWSAALSGQARFVRLRVTRRSSLHLQRVELR